MFSSLKIIDLSTVLAGPSVATFFAELGAKVIKIENPNVSDVTRSWKLSSEDPNSSVSAYFSSVNYKKEYLKLDLRKTEDYLSLTQHVKEADILISNFKRADYDKFKLDDSTLFQINPKLIHGKISGYGSDSDRVAYDLILQAESGFMSMNGTKESGPVKMPVALIDVLAAHHLKEAILIALIERAQTNKGKSVSVSLYDTAICSLVNQASNYLMEGKIPERIGSLHPNIAPYGEIFETLDKQQITFAIGSDKHFVKLCHFLGLEYLPNENDFSSNQKRVENRKKLFQILQEEVRKIDAKNILAWTNEYFVPCGKIKNLEEVFQDEKVKKFILEEEIDGVLTKRMSSIAFQ
jgi:crotonobetainyl-CoA:carnitine CoA-transferase CaiB-like acyl-CoA transferase